MTNLTAIRGDDLTLTLNFTDTTTLLPIDISGWKIYFTIKRDVSISDASADLQKVYTIVDGSSGEASIYISAAESTLLTDKYFYDVECINDVLNVTTPVYGSITFIADVTRSIS